MSEDKVDQYELRHKIRRGEAPGLCREPGCGRVVWAKGLCQRHYGRQRRQKRRREQQL